MSIRLVTAESIRNKTFPLAREIIIDTLLNNQKLDVLIGAPQGAGKSWWVDQLVVELATMAMEIADTGKNVIIAVPSGDLAKEHKDRIVKMGGDAHLLRSHEATFKGREYECPDYEEIQYLYKIGVESRHYKDIYCKNCPYFQSCEYPKQYSEAIEPQNKIVIMQHAHFKCRETLLQLFQNKAFDVLIIDESFIDNLIETIKPTEFEVEALLAFGETWSTKLGEWLRDGGEGRSTLRPSPQALEALKKTFDDSNQVWRLKPLLDAYNGGMYLDAFTGIKNFFPAPQIPIRVLTDATPTEEELKIVLNTDTLVTVGKGEVLNIKHYNKDNEIIQVIDSSLSKSSLMKDEKFYEFLNFIGDKCRGDFKDDKVLITTFKDKEDFAWTQEVIDYLHLKYPSLDVGQDPLVNRIVVDGMKVGVNTYSSFSVQFLMCSVYMSASQIAQAAYKTRMAINYWRRKKGEDLIQNILPRSGEMSLEMEQIPVRKIEPDGVYEYPDFKVMVPVDKYERMAYDKNIGKSQQAIRIRFTENIERRKVVYIFGNYNFPSLLITKTVLLDDIYAELN